MISKDEKTQSATTKPQASDGIIWDCVEMGAGYSASEGLLRNVTMKIKAGERVALLGKPNGGRFMFFRCLVGLRPVREGSLAVFGQTMDRLPYYADWDQIMPQATRRRMGVCLEVEGLLSNVTVREGMELLFRFKYGDHNQKLRDGAAKIVKMTCHKFSLDECFEKRPFLMTAAEKRLAGLARAFLSKPHVIALENPSQSIGDLNRERLWKALETICEQNERTVVISTDDWAIARKFCNRWIVLDEGKVEFDGTPAEFLKSDHTLIDQLRALEKIHKQYLDLFQEAA